MPDQINAIVLYPSPGWGHLIAMVELGKLILQHHPSFSITVIVFHTQNMATPTFFADQYVTAINATCPSITFLHLPPVSDTPPPSTTSSSSPLEIMVFLLPLLNNTNLHQALRTISQTSNVKAFIIDFFCDAAFQVAANLCIPTYYFITSSALALVLALCNPTHHKSMDKSSEGLDHMLADITGLPLIPASDLPRIVTDRGSQAYQFFLNCGINMARANGLIVNSFEQLERKAIKAISDGLCVADGPTPPVFGIGPLISLSNNQGTDNEQHDQCMNWLNSQPSQSVVFLCYGSMGLFSAEQLKEIAAGLENSGQRFLWVVRNPPPDNDKEPKLDELLPKGFLERTNDRGFVMKQWAPQVEVLSHDSVGGFVTHCGWNSLLEAVCGGVPMIGWPLFAEQRMNRVIMVKELKVALAVNESENGWVSGEELEKRVRELMDSDEGKEVRKRVSAMRDAAAKAMRKGGSSRNDFEKLVGLWLS
ncbi:anthocyanidin 5,3-O-glucosyltransferase-like [Carya illinoinensis]|uniref:Glycosyltransferase n=1 Tax=Carya illinoinensis TaxID=32201 RepID=A0A8T1Q6S6_CARIL|nr:anthocyanidin 5,3-O-glucosyltransferase-like [Carya illinoinensis]KAG6649892.1 hypothetical protein CIPAW_06G005200 [Carya illinoinensis]